MDMGALAPSFPLEMLKSVFFMQMLSKTSVDEVFMHHFEKMSASGGFTRDPHRGAAPDRAEGLLSFKPRHCLPLKQKSCRHSSTTLMTEDDSMKRKYSKCVQDSSEQRDSLGAVNASVTIRDVKSQTVNCSTRHATSSVSCHHAAV